jgi:hypothetical protein
MRVIPAADYLTVVSVTRTQPAPGLIREPGCGAVADLWYGSAIWKFGIHIAIL